MSPFGRYRSLPLWLRISVPVLGVALMAGLILTATGANPQLAASILGLVGAVIFFEVIFWEARALFQRNPTDDD